MQIIPRNRLIRGEKYDRKNRIQSLSLSLCFSTPLLYLSPSLSSSFRVRSSGTSIINLIVLISNLDGIEPRTL